LTEVVEGFFLVGDEVVAPSRIDDDVINVDFYVATYLPLEAELHTLLIRGPAFFSPYDIFT
jgi:hypothetical protein